MSEIATTDKPRARPKRRPRPRGQSGRAVARVGSASSFAILMLVLEGAIALLRCAAYVFPTPSAIAVALWHGLVGGSYLPRSRSR